MTTQRRKRTPEEIEKSKRIAAEIMAKSKIGDVEKQVKNARITLFVLAGLFIIIGIYEGYVADGHDEFFAYIDWGLAALYIGLGFWSKTRPFTAILIGFILYIALILMNAFLDPMTLVSGILWKIVIISFLVKGLQSTKHLPKQIHYNDDDLIDHDFVE